MRAGLIGFKAPRPVPVPSLVSAPLPRPGELVAYYRLYLLSAPEGRFIGFEEIEAVDDVEAVRRAESFSGDHPLELWCGTRKIRSIPAESHRGT